MQQSKFDAKLIDMKSEFLASKKIVRKYSREKWTQAYDGGKRYGHMTTNFVECMNFALKGAHTLPIIVSVKATFERIKACSVERGMHVSSMLHVGHGYPKKVAVMLQENRFCVEMHHVQRYTRETS